MVVKSILNTIEKKASAFGAKAIEEASTPGKKGSNKNRIADEKILNSRKK